MSVVSLSITILRPAGDVFAILTDVGNAAKWSSALEKELLTPGPLRVGSRRRAVVPGFAGRTMENEMELTEPNVMSTVVVQTGLGYSSREEPWT